eukprot:COSAG02_NODE_307_length_25111_cov_5.306693_23_plen_550_part_00
MHAMQPHTHRRAHACMRSCATDGPRLAMALMVSPAVHALAVALSLTTVDTGSPRFTVLNDTDLRGPLLSTKPGTSAFDCAVQCLAMPACVAVVWNGPNSHYRDLKCGFKCATGGKTADPGEQAVIVRPSVDKCHPAPRPPPPTPPTPPPRPPPLVPVPAEWAEPVERSEMLFSGLAMLQPLPLNANIGNGYVGATVGCFPQNCGGVLSGRQQVGSVLRSGGVNCIVSGVIHVAGVYSGAGTQSERAALPGVHAVWVEAAGPNGTGPVEFAGSALDLKGARFLNRTRLPACSGATLEQRWFAHRDNRSLLVYEMELLPPVGSVQSTSVGSCMVRLGSCIQPNSTAMDALGHWFDETSGVETRLLRTRVPESNHTDYVTVAQHYDRVPELVALSTSSGGSQQLRSFIAAIRTSLPDEGLFEARNATAAAARDYAIAKNQSVKELRRSHARAWANLRRSRLEVGVVGKPNATTQAVSSAINSSYYYLLSSIRADWQGSHGTSPGGLANSAYEGHTFWDSEEWCVLIRVLLSLFVVILATFFDLSNSNGDRTW